MTPYNRPSGIHCYLWPGKEEQIHSIDAIPFYVRYELNRAVLHPYPQTPTILTAIYFSLFFWPVLCSGQFVLSACKFKSKVS